MLSGPWVRGQWWVGPFRCWKGKVISESQLRSLPAWPGTGPNLAEDFLSHTLREALRAASSQESRWQMGQSLRGQLSSYLIRQTWQRRLRLTFLATDTFQMGWWILERGPWTSKRDYEERRVSRPHSTPSESGFHGQTGVSMRSACKSSSQRDPPEPWSLGTPEGDLIDILPMGGSFRTPLWLIISLCEAFWQDPGVENN